MKQGNNKFMKRKIYDKLVEWKNTSNGSTALLIEGARRVGKSYIVEKFAKDNYKSYLLIDFAKVNNDIKSLIDSNLENLDYLFSSLSVIYNKELYNRQSLIIFDEVQRFPRAREAIKFLVADGRFDYIETGSLISIKKNVKDILIPSEEERIQMNPMDFEEFLWAMDNKLIMDNIKYSFKNKKPLGLAVHKKAMEYFKQYMIIGGMPQSVKNFINTNSYIKTDKIKREIINLYRDDIRKHSDKLNLKVEKIFETIPSQLQKHEKKFNLSTLSEDARYRSYEGAFFWLADAKIINIAYNTTEPNIGLGQRINDNSLKCYFADTGLLLSMAFDEKTIISEELYKKIILGKLSFNEGMIMENIVSQLLVSSGNKLYFFSTSDRKNSSNNLKVDFLISKNKITNKHNIIPIEVKSSERYTYTSLNKLIEKYSNYLDTPIILHTKDLEFKNGILFLPLYMAILF